MMKSYAEFLQDEVRKLEDYADLEGSELGEYCHALITLQRFEYMMSADFVKAVRLAIINQLEWFRENTQVVTEEEAVVKLSTRTLKFLDES